MSDVHGDFKLISHDPLSGVSHYLHVDKMTGEMHTLTRQDPTKVIESNKAHAYDAKGTLGKTNFVKVATIPNGVIADWLAEGVDVFNPDQWRDVAKRLDDGDNRDLRVAQFRIGDAD